MYFLLFKEGWWEGGVMRLFSHAKKEKEVTQMLRYVMSGGGVEKWWKNSLHNFLMSFSQNN